MKQSISNDLFRWYGTAGEPFIKRIFREPALKFMIAFRKAQESKKSADAVKTYVSVA